MSKSSAFLSLDPIELSPSRFGNIEIVARHELATSLRGLNEYDKQQIRSLS